MITLPVKAAVGVITCLLYERTGSLLLGIALHSLVDGSGFEAAVSGKLEENLTTPGGLVIVPSRDPFRVANSSA